MKILRTLTKCWTYDNDYVANDVKVRDFVISLENIEALCIEIAKSILNQNSCCISQPEES